MKHITFVFLLFVITTTVVSAENPMITSYNPYGEISWTNSVDANARYRVEWASELDSTWTPLAGAGGAEFRGIEASTNTSFSEEVPMFFRVSTITNIPPTNMVLIPSGTFAMGDPFDEGSSAERPVHDVYIDAFWMGRHEVTHEEWQPVYEWATNNAYDFTYSGSTKGTYHPVHTITWYDAVKWCNAKSEMENRTPCYYTVNMATVYRSGQVNISIDRVLWQGDGYRLPTEAEWEHAARGGKSGKRFSWGNTISFSQANYDSWWQNGSPYYEYDHAYTNGYHPAFDDGSDPRSSPIGQFAPNAYGLYDMIGNMREWCWDWYSTTYYSSSTNVNPKGPDVIAVSRSARGGSWSGNAYYCRTARRSAYQPNLAYTGVSFRYVIGQP